MSGFFPNVSLLNTAPETRWRLHRSIVEAVSKGDLYRGCCIAAIPLLISAISIRLPSMRATVRFSTYGHNSCTPEEWDRCSAQLSYVKYSYRHGFHPFRKAGIKRFALAPRS